MIASHLYVGVVVCYSFIYCSHEFGAAQGRLGRAPHKDRRARIGGAETPRRLPSPVLPPGGPRLLSAPGSRAPGSRAPRPPDGARRALPVQSPGVVSSCPFTTIPCIRKCTMTRIAMPIELQYLHSAEGGAVETGCSDLYGAIYCFTI